jgi:hypothetical protein
MTAHNETSRHEPLYRVTCSGRMLYEGHDSTKAHSVYYNAKATSMETLGQYVALWRDSTLLLEHEGTE